MKSAHQNDDTEFRKNCPLTRDWENNGRVENREELSNSVYSAPSAKVDTRITSNQESFIRLWLVVGSSRGRGGVRVKAGPRRGVFWRGQLRNTCISSQGQWSGSRCSPLPARSQSHSEGLEMAPAMNTMKRVDWGGGVTFRRAYPPFITTRDGFSVSRRLLSSEKTALNEG